MASHRLIQYIGKHFGLAVSEAVYDRLNEYYFVEGHALNDKPRLARVVVGTLREVLSPDGTICPEEQEILEFLDGNEGRKEIEDALETLQELGVHSVPKFIIEGRTVIDGAAKPGVFVDVFRAIENRGFLQSQAVFADILGVPPETIQAGSHTREHFIMTAS